MAVQRGFRQFISVAASFTYSVCYDTDNMVILAVRLKPFYLFSIYYFGEKIDTG